MEIWIKQVAGKVQAEHFFVGTNLHICFRSKTDIRKVSTVVGEVFNHFFYVYWK